ncbi:hypothetical protein [Streptomyces hyaluromycini]|uniref:hypothetical protein n=1 Tax=Streptomyces hyaluromycini TaxID=1377993 RepID=UPI0011AE8D5F|nr:hypothetical protein [Streptomyces hyaluromycini]
MAYARGFCPWIAAGFVTAADWRWGAVAGPAVFTARHPARVRARVQARVQALRARQAATS